METMTDTLSQLRVLHREVERRGKPACNECSRYGRLVTFPCRTYRLLTGRDTLIDSWGPYEY